jgi:hypothetical protein
MRQAAIRARKPGRRARLAVASAAAAILSTLVLPVPARAEIDCDKIPTPAGCSPQEPPIRHNPEGLLSEVTRNRGLVTVRGTVQDPDAPGALVYVAISVDGQYLLHGGGAPAFEVTLVTSTVPGPHTVCADAQNIGEGRDVRIGCLTYVTPSPVGQPLVTFRALSASRVLVEWEPADYHAAGFQIDRTYGVSWETVTTLPAGARRYEQSGLQPNTPICVRVLAVNDFYQQGGTVCGHTLLPALPRLTENQTSLTEVTPHGARVHWTDNSGTAAVYLVDLLNGTEIVRRQVVDSATRSYAFDGLWTATYGIRVTRHHPSHELPDDLGQPTEYLKAARPEIALGGVACRARVLSVKAEWWDSYAIYVDGELLFQAGPASEVHTVAWIEKPLPQAGQVIRLVLTNVHGGRRVWEWVLTC